MPFRVALTLDAEHPDRPTRPGIAEGILDLLDHERVLATFFVQGRWAEAYPGTAREMARAGHLIGNHSHYHVRMPLLSPEGFAADVADADRVIREATGVDPKPWFRCPFGVGSDDPEIARRLVSAGYRPPVGWHVDPYDWAAPDGDSAQRVIVDATLAHGDGAIVLAHTWPTATLDALPAVIRRLRDSGAAFVRLDALEDVPVTAAPAVQPFPDPWLRVIAEPAPQLPEK